MFKKMKENKKKGFTLVELIVVLVILAILAALLIPALTGYIDRAKEKSIIAETRQVVMAAQTLADEQYAEDASKNPTLKNNEILDLADLKGKSAGTIGTITWDSTNKGKIASLEYTKGGKTCTYKADGSGTDGKYSVTAASETKPAE